MKKRSHERSTDKKGFSIALPITLINDLQAIANLETRTRNGQIEHFLTEQVKLWKAKNNPAAPQAKPRPAAAPGSSEPIGRNSREAVKKPIRHNSRS